MLRWAKKGHGRNIPVKLFQNLASIFGEVEFLYDHIVQEASIHQSHVYGRIKISQTICEKGHRRNIPVKLFQNLTSGFREDLLRNSSFPYSARSPHSPEPCFWEDQNFANNFWKGSWEEHSCVIILKSDQRFQRRRYLKNSLKNSISLPWLMESNSVNNFWRGPPKEHSCQVWSKLAQQFGRRCLKKLLTTHDRRRTHHHPKSSPWARCAQVS